MVYGIFLLLAAIVSATMLRTPAVPRRGRARTESALAEQVAEAVLAEPALPGEALADAALGGAGPGGAGLGDGALDDTLARPAGPAAARSAGPLRTALRSRAGPGPRLAARRPDL